MTRKPRKRLVSGLAGGLMGVCGPLCVMAQGDVRGNEPAQPEVRLPLMSKAPTLDGVVDEKEWSGAARMERLTSGQPSMLDAQESSFWVGCDGKDLYIAMVSQTPPDGELVAKVPPAPEGRDARTWLDDSVELVLDPLRSDTTGRRLIYHANLNARGAINDMAYQPRGAAQPWRGHWRMASKVVGDRWHFEIAIPLADMGVKQEDLAKPFGVRVVRNWIRVNKIPNQSEWSPLGGAYLNPDTMPVVTWDAAAPVVGVHGLTARENPEKVHLRVSVANPGSAPMEVMANIRVAPAQSAPEHVEQVVVVPAGESRWVELSATPSSKTEKLVTVVRVASRDGQKVYYQRHFTWSLERPENLWKKDTEDQKKLDLNFAYYPSFDTVAAQLNYGAIPQREKVAGVTFTIYSKDGKEPISSTRVEANASGVARKTWKIPALGQGEYRCVAEAQESGVDPATVHFVRNIMPWEGNKLGKSDVILQGFEPILAENGVVSTVLRKHELDGMGLWKQVISAGTPMLESPVRLEVTVGGQKALAQGEGLELKQEGPTHATTKARWSAGPVSGTAQATWDMDGVMWWTLKIAPSETPIERMTVVIPIPDRLSPLMHACTDGVRFNYAGRVPEGEGVVWDGRKAPRNSIVGSYVPYIWVGAEERGLCVFGENDRGWVTSKTVPCQELVRNGKTLELRLNVVASRAAITQEREITIGFQATPTKPMPKEWRRWVGDQRYATPDLKAWTGFMGSCLYWGSLTASQDIYPVNADYSFWDELAKTRKSGQIDKTFIESWMTRYPASTTAEHMATRRRHVIGGFALAAARPDRMAVYTNARGVRFDTPEGQTFLDEWSREQFTTRKWAMGTGTSYDLNPGESFRDYALWNYNKMLDTFVDDIYADDIFLQSDFDLVGTEAYQLPDGEIQPSSGLRDMRELIRRTLALGREKDRTMYNWVHITNTAIAPIISFAQITYTWEDQSGDRPFQERFSQDYIRTESLGLQHGTIPVALLLISGPDKEKNAWAARTAAGVMLTHEIRTRTPIPSLQAGLKTLWTFGYGLEGINVYNYWQENYPLKIEGGKTSSLVVGKPGEAIITLCDWSGGGDLRITPGAELGLGNAFTATNVETGEAVEVKEGVLSVPLKKHDFQMIRIKAAEGPKEQAQ